jgi:hypothetical protein
MIYMATKIWNIFSTITFHYMIKFLLQLKLRDEMRSESLKREGPQNVKATGNIFGSSRTNVRPLMGSDCMVYVSKTQNSHDSYKSVATGCFM